MKGSFFFQMKNKISLAKIGLAQFELINQSFKKKKQQKIISFLQIKMYIKIKTIEKNIKTKSKQCNFFLLVCVYF